MVKGAVRTDFILSAEIMVIALNEVLDEHLAMRGATLAVVAVLITVAVYGVVGLIVKMDDIGLHMAKEGSRGRSSEEHTSELQSLMRISYAVFCLKKKL